jgi:hypothetical protein
MSDVEALQTALAAEHAAVFVLGTLGGRASRSAMPSLSDAITAAYAAHRARRDQLTAEITDSGSEPVAAEAAYDVPSGLVRADRIARVALDTERACATTYGWLVANTTGEQRSRAVAALTESAVRELAFGGRPADLPGT